jgi:hypothetical protein
MKGIFYSSVLLSALFIAPLAANAQGMEAGDASLSAGANINEGGAGYHLGLNWQFSKFAAFHGGVSSNLNADRYPMEQFIAESELGEDLTYNDYKPNDFRPRHNSYELKFTLRYPVDLSRDVFMAPYAEAGMVSMSTKSVEFTESNRTNNGGGSNDGSNQSDSNTLTAHFDSINAFRFGVGAQFNFKNEHILTAGVVGYSISHDWDNSAVPDSQQGVFAQYEYRLDPRFGLVFGYESIDQFGNPFLRAGFNWIFN